MSLSLAATTLISSVKTVAEGTAAVSNIVDLAKRLYDGTVGRVNDNLGTPTDRVLSLTEHTKQTTLRSRVYIDNSLADQDVIPNVVRALHTMYTGLILNALNLSQFVTSGKTVQDFVGSVATESFAPYRDVQVELAELTASLESFDIYSDLRKSGGFTDTELSLIKELTVKNPKFTKDEIIAEIKRRRGETIQKISTDKDALKLATKDIEVAPPSIAPVGKLIEVELTNPNDGSKSAKILLAVQMVPYLIPAGLAAMFINKDTSLSFGNRLLMWRAGEISFFRDLIFQVDRLSKNYEVAKNDQSRLFYDFMQNVAKKDKATVTKNLAQASATKSHNLANSVMIFSSDAVAQAKAESGIDLHHADVRNRYFRDTFAMMIAVVDPMFNQVTLYMNGIDDVGVYSFSQFYSGGSNSNGGIDLIKSLATFTAGKAPRF